VLALVFVNPFDLDVEQRIGIDDDTRACPDFPGQPHLVRALDRSPLLAELRSVRERLELRQFLLGVADPRVADGLGDQAGEPDCIRP